MLSTVGENKRYIEEKKKIYTYSKGDSEYTSRRIQTNIKVKKRTKSHKRNMIRRNVQNRDKKECVPGDRHGNFPKT